MLADLRNQLFRHLQRLSLGFYERNRAGVIISRLTNDVEALDQLVTDGVTSLVQNTLTLLGTAIILFFLDWRLALATLVVMPLMTLATALFRKRSGRAYRDVRETLGAVDGDARRGHRRHARRCSRSRRERAARAELPRRQRRTTASRTCRRSSSTASTSRSSTSSPSVATAIVLGYGGWLAYHGEISIGMLVAFLGYLTNFFDPVQQLSQLYNTFLSAVAALDKITDRARRGARGRRRARPP